jgi:hypothetical protein
MHAAYAHRARRRQGAPRPHCVGPITRRALSGAAAAERARGACGLRLRAAISRLRSPAPGADADQIENGPRDDGLDRCARSGSKPALIFPRRSLAICAGLRRVCEGCEMTLGCTCSQTQSMT